MGVARGAGWLWPMVMMSRLLDLPQGKVGHVYWFLKNNMKQCWKKPLQELWRGIQSHRHCQQVICFHGVLTFPMSSNPPISARLALEGQLVQDCQQGINSQWSCRSILNINNHIIFDDLEKVFWVREVCEFSLLDEPFGRTMKRIDFRTVWPIFNFWNASVVTIMVRDVQGVYYIALFLGVTWSQIVLYIFQSFLIDFRFISCFAKPFLMMNHWMMQTMHVLHFVICVWLELIEVISSHLWCCQSQAVLLVSRRPF